MPSFKFASATGSGSSLIVTCAEQFAGKTITCTNGTKTYTRTCPSTSPYEVVFKGVAPGTWTVSGVVEGTTYSQQVVITDFDVTLTAGFDYKQWVILGGLDPTDYTDLEDVFADEVAVRRLMTIHASADYLIEKVTDDVDTIDDFVANDTAMKWIGLRDYVCDGLTAITGVEAKFLASQYWERYLKDHVPVMTSNTAPYGTARASSEASSHSAYYAFNDDTSTYWQANGNTTSSYVSYQFTNPIDVRKAAVRNSQATGLTTFTYTVQYSDDGTNWTNIAETSTVIPNATTEYIDVPSVGYHLYWRINIVSSALASHVSSFVQFYGRSLDVSVPTMTSDTAPYGEVIYSAQSTTSSYYAYKAFDGSNSSLWTSGSNDVPQYIGYAFDTEVKIKKVLASFGSSNVSATYDIQASNDGINYYDLATGLTATGSTTVVSDIVSNNTYKYYRINITSQSRGQNTVGQVSTLQFYGVDYSEKEFETGTTKKWLYDHGVELDGYSFISNCSTGNSMTKNPDDITLVKGNTSLASTNLAYALTNNPIDLTNYSYAFSRIDTLRGESAVGFTIKSSNNSSSYVAPVASTSKQYFNKMDVTSIDCSSINQNEYLGFGSGYNEKTFTAKLFELWVE